MNGIDRLREQLRETETAAERLDRLAAENPADAVIVFNLRAVRKRKEDLERRLKVEVETLQSDKTESTKTIAQIPVQLGRSVQFRISENHKIEFATEPRSANDFRRLEQLHPLLRSLSGELIEALDVSNVPYEYLHKRAQAYNVLIVQDLERIDFVHLFVEGVRLENAARASEQSDLAVPDSYVRELMQSLLNIHFGFIEASAEGAALLEATAAYRHAKFPPLLQNSDAQNVPETSLWSRKAFEAMRSDMLLSMREVAEEIHNMTDQQSSQIHHLIVEYGRQQNSGRIFAIGLVQHVASTFLISAVIASLSALLSDSVELAIIVGALAAVIGTWAFKGFGWLKYPGKDRTRDDN